MKILILAGGKGSRLWPLTDPPKQFFLRDDSFSLFQKTLLRFLPVFPPEDIIVLTQERFLSLAQNQIASLSINISCLTEAEGRNTAPALLSALEKIEGELFFVAPSDQILAPEKLFLEKLVFAKKHCHQCSAVLFGIYPTMPHPGFGYIECNPQEDLSPVSRFVEKPSYEQAREFLNRGNWLWNSGMLLLNKEAFLAELFYHHPEYLKHCPSLSLDVAFLESFRNLKVVPLALSWSDMGSWDAVYDAYQKDENNNVCMGKTQLLGTKNSLVFSTHRQIKVIDGEDLLIAESEQGVVIIKRGSSQKLFHVHAQPATK